MSLECKFYVGQGNNKGAEKKRGRHGNKMEKRVEKNHHRHPQEVLLWPPGIDGFVWLSLYPEKTNEQSPSISPCWPMNHGLIGKVWRPVSLTYYLSTLRLPGFLPSFLFSFLPPALRLFLPIHLAPSQKNIYLLCVYSWVWDITASKMEMDSALKVLRM